MTDPERRDPERARVRDPVLEEEMALVELVSRVLDRGVVLVGDVMISVAGVDLVQLGLSLYVSSVETARLRRGDARGALPDSSDRSDRSGPSP